MQVPLEYLENIQSENIINCTGRGNGNLRLDRFYRYPWTGSKKKYIKKPSRGNKFKARQYFFRLIRYATRMYKCNNYCYFVFLTVKRSFSAHQMSGGHVRHNYFLDFIINWNYTFNSGICICNTKYTSCPVPGISRISIGRKK